MNLLECFQISINEVEDNLENENLTISGIAKKVGLSSFYFQRLFLIYTSITIGEYIRNRRLSLAGQQLHNNPDLSIIDTALRYGYETQESFSKAFKRFHGCTPLEAKKGHKLNYYPRLEINVEIKGGKTMDYKIEQEKEFEIVVLTKKFSNDTSMDEIPHFWDEYMKKGYDKVVPPMLGICLEGYNNDTCAAFEYGIGSIKECVKKVPSGFKTMKVPATLWAKFYAHGPCTKTVQGLWKEVYKKWLPNSGYEVIKGFDFECYSEGDMDDPNYEVGIWLPVRKIK